MSIHCFALSSFDFQNRYDFLYTLSQTTITTIPIYWYCFDTRQEEVNSTVNCLQVIVDSEK